MPVDVVAVSIAGLVLGSLACGAWCCLFLLCCCGGTVSVNGNSVNDVFKIGEKP